MKYDIILASASPRRREILKAGGYDFIVRPSDIDESVTASDPGELVMELAEQKAHACEQSLMGEQGYDINGKLIIGADTLVFLDDTRMGKPANIEEWTRYIKMMSGRKHSVITGVALIYDGRCETFYSETIVTVDDITDEEIAEYIELGEDMDKAGGYAIQGQFAKFIPCIEGEYNNVVGFPIAHFRKKLAELGLE